MWNISLEVHAYTREAALETLKLAYEDAVKTDYKDANSGPVIWGHMSRQSGLVIEEIDSSTAPCLGWPQGRLRLQRERDSHLAEAQRISAILGDMTFERRDNA